MFHNILMTSLTPLRNTSEISGWENRPFITKWPEIYQNHAKKGQEIKRPIKKKPKRIRTTFTTEQLNILEEVFLKTPYINRKEREDIVRRSKIGDRQVKIWFQNRRMKQKRNSSDTSTDTDTSSAASPPIISSTTNENTYNHDLDLLSDILPNIPSNDAASNITVSQEPLPNFTSIPNDSHGHQIPSSWSGNFVQEGNQLHNTSYDFIHENNVYQTEYYPNNCNSFGYTQYNDGHSCEHVNGNWYDYINMSLTDHVNDLG